MNDINIQQGTPEWLEFRKDKVGASDAPVIMGVSPWETPYQLWQRKLCLLKDQKENRAMAYGKKNEALARSLLEEMTGMIFSPIVKLHRSRPWMLASLDAIDIEEKVISEIKCAGKDDHDLAVQKKVPEKYYPQLQHQMEVCEVDKCLYFSFFDGYGAIVEVFRDDKYIKGMLAKEEEFIECVHELIAPKLSSRDYQETHDETWIQYAEEWRTVNEQLSALEEKEKSLRQSLIGIAGDRNLAGGGIRMSKLLRKGNVDYGKIPVLREINLEEYRKSPTEYWKILKS